MRRARRGCDCLSLAEDALDAFHPQTELAGEDLETLLLARVDMVGPVVHPGSPIQSTWSSSPLVCRAVFRNTVLSPVTGFTSSSPALTKPCPPLSSLFQLPRDAASRAVD